MTISNQTTKHVYDGNGTATQWPYTFQLLEDDTTCIHVYLVSPSGVITETVQFTVDTDNLKVVYPSVASELPPLASGWKIVLLRLEPITQALDLINQGTFNAEAIEAELDKLTMICQQLSEVLGRTVQFTLDDSGSDLSSVKFLSDCQAAQDAAEASASAASSSASAASASASSASTSAGTATTKAAEAAASAAEAAEILSSVDVHLASNQTFTGTNTFTKQIQASGGIYANQSYGEAGSGIIKANVDGIGAGGEVRLDQNQSTNLRLSGMSVPFISFKSDNGQLQFQNMSTGSTVAYISTGGTIRSLAGFIGATYFLLMNSGYTQLAQLLADGTNTFLDFTGSLKFRTGVGGTEKASIDASGNVAASGNLTISGTGDSSVAGKLGIGTVSPTEKLEVSGNVKITGTSGTNYIQFPDGSKMYSAYSGNPAGTVIAFAGSTCPAGYLVANGSAISRTGYASLFSVLGTTYGTGDGSTTFNLPDMRGYFVRGYDSGAGVDSGRTFGSIQDDAMQGHRHNFHDGTSQLAESRSNAAGQIANVQSGGSANINSIYIWDPITDGTNGTPRTAAETRPKNIALQYCIKY